MKKLGYRILSSRIFKPFLSFLCGFGLKILLFKKIKKEQQKKDFLIAITVDTESGYINKDETRTWLKDNANAFQGYYYGIRNLLKLGKKYGIKFTFLLCTQCFSAKGEDYLKIIAILKEAYRQGHEIGFHLHPKYDFTLQNYMKKKLEYTGSKYYSSSVIIEMLKSGRKIIEKHLGKKIANSINSFRWGNWAISLDKIKLLEKARFKMDSSICPGIQAHKGKHMQYNWTLCYEMYPFKISKILEIPNTTFSFFGKQCRADPALGQILIEAFKKYYKKADRSKRKFVFTVLTHSSELTMKDGFPSKVLRSLRDFIKYAKNYKGLRFVKLKDLR